MSDGENEYNYSKSKETTKFIITNKSRRARRYRLVLEETSNYEHYEETAITKFSPEGDHYVRLQATVGSTIIPATALNNIKIDIASSQNNNYLIYEGKLGAQASTAVTVILYIDYEPLDNKFQDKTFRGTIRLYYVSDDE